MFLWALLIPAGAEAPDCECFVQKVASIFLCPRSGALKSSQSRSPLQPPPPSGLWTAADVGKNNQAALPPADRADAGNRRQVLDHARQPGLADR